MDGEWKDGLAVEIARARRVVVLGVGNADKGDDGVGPLCAGLLGRKAPANAGERLLVIDGRDVPESQTGPIRRFGPDLTVIVDAAVGGRAPGTIFLVDWEKISDDGVSTHHVSLLYLVRYLEESVGSRVLVLGIEPADLGEGKTISAPVRASAIQIADFISEMLNDRVLGLVPEGSKPVDELCSVLRGSKDE
jgi:hydrogenase maturation protease HycI